MSISEQLDERAAMLARLEDYSNQETPGQVRDRLVARWREEYPDAAAESSPTLKPLMQLEWRKEGTEGPDEVWLNDTYNVTVRRFEKDPVFNSRSGGMVQIGISSFDGTARHDWRDFQAIKNQLAGGECEAFEMYPAESRLLDPSNYYTLWCFPGVRNLKIGQSTRLVRDADQAWAPQRTIAVDPNGAFLEWLERVAPETLRTWRETYARYPDTNVSPGAETQKPERGNLTCQNENSQSKS